MRTLIDTWVLNQFQKVSDFFQEWLGIDNFLIAKISGVIAIIFYSLEIIFSFLRGANFFDVISIFIFFAGCFFGRLITRNMEENCRKHPDCLNPAVLKLLRLRVFALFSLMFFLTLLPLEMLAFFHSSTNQQKYYLLSVFCSNIFFLFIFLFLYFVSCTPKPYKTSKLKNLVKKIIGIVKTLGEKITVPVPIPSAT